MERIGKHLLTAFAAVGLWACAEEHATSPTDDRQDGEHIYMGMTLSFQSGSIPTRSSADTSAGDGYASSADGTEPGKEGETGIAELLLVLADTDNRNIAAGLLENAEPEHGTDAGYVIPIPYRLLKDHAAETINVYIFCNPTPELKSLAMNTPQGTLPTDFVDKTYTVSDFETDEAWKQGHFPMSNARMYTTTLPDNWSHYRSASSPFPLLGDTKIEVERSVARFDYKTTKPENKYPVSIDAEHLDQTENPGVFIQLTDGAFINVSNSFYYLRRVSGEDLSNLQICGTETAHNYVVDTDASYKLHIADGWETKNDHFFSNLEQPDTWKWTPLSSLTQTEEDSEWGDDTEATRGYHIWRYVTENTAPSRESQVNSIRTGIVFKGRIIPGAGCDSELANALETGTEPIYLYGNRLYGTWSMTEKAGQDNEDLLVAWNAVEHNGVPLTEAGFTEYKPVNGVYENYYFYWNLHNDNGIDDPNNPTFLGPMKFAVVRNNVYKLNVEAIFNFGRPDRVPPEEPDTANYMMVSVKVLPWVMKEYDITIEEPTTYMH